MTSPSTHIGSAMHQNHANRIGHNSIEISFPLFCMSLSDVHWDKQVSTDQTKLSSKPRKHGQTSLVFLGWKMCFLSADRHSWTGKPFTFWLVEHEFEKIALFVNLSLTNILFY